MAVQERTGLAGGDELMAWCWQVADGKWNGAVEHFLSTRDTSQKIVCHLCCEHHITHSGPRDGALVRLAVLEQS